MINDFRLALRTKYPRISFEATEVINQYTLLSIGLSWTDIYNISAEKADKLLMLHQEIKKYEEEQMKKAKINAKSRRR